MSEFRVKIKTDGRSARDSAEEIDKQLSRVAVSLAMGDGSGRLRDDDGNEVGEFYFVE